MRKLERYRLGSLIMFCFYFVAQISRGIPSIYSMFVIMIHNLYDIMIISLFHTVAIISDLLFSVYVFVNVLLFIVTSNSGSSGTFFTFTCRLSILGSVV